MPPLDNGFSGEVRARLEEARTSRRAPSKPARWPRNSASIAFHARLGFAILPGDAERDNGVAFTRDYDGPGEDRVRFPLTL